MNNILFHHSRKAKLTDIQKLRAFILERCRSQNYHIDCIQFIFVDDKSLLHLNQHYLQHDYYTDILTFEFSNTPKHLLADIYISIDRVKDNAHQYQVPYNQECHRIIFHGILHLLGYSDATPTSKQAMTLMEDEWLQYYFI